MLCLCLRSDSPDCCSPLWPGDGALLCRSTICFYGGETPNYRPTIILSRTEHEHGFFLQEYTHTVHAHTRISPFFSDVMCDCGKVGA